MTDKGIPKRISVSSSSKNRISLPTGGPSSSSKISSKPHSSGLSSPGSPEQSPLIPHIKIQDNLKVLPKYTAALSTTLGEDLIPAEDLDMVQLELELLLSTVALRYRVLKAEIETLDKADERRERKGKFMDKQPSSPGKKKRLEEKQKLRESAGKLFGHQMKLSKLKNMSPLVPPSPAPSQHTDDSMDAVPYLQNNPKENPKMLLPKNDTPNKFWMSVEPYCMPITHEDLKLLDDLLEEYSGPLIPPIPELGPHYSTQWAADDIKEEQDSSNANSKTKSRTMTNGDVLGMKKGDKIMGEGVTGPLTQRLVSALMEENLLPDCNSTSNENSNSSSDITHSNSRSAVSLLKNGISIERRLRKELIEQGILDADDMPKSQQDDEILTEIKRVRTELGAIAEYNSNEVKKLQSMAIDEMKRLEVKSKLDQIDLEIIESYKKILSARQKRRPITKQERDEVYRLTEEQKRLSDQLELMPVAGPHFVNNI